MKSCPHAGWVEVSDTRERSLVDPGRFRRLTSGLDNPETQRPQVLICIGGEEKRRALGHLFPKYESSSRQEPQSLADLHLDASRSHLEEPILFADCTPEGSVQVRNRGTTCHDSKPVDDTCVLPATATNDFILTRVLFPFADAICVFADDLGGLDPVFEYLKAWSAGDVASTLPWRARPRVSVITFAPLTSEAYREQRSFSSRLRAIKFRRHFSSVRLMRFWPRATALSRDRAVCKFILHDELGIARARRKCERVLFAAHHLSWFFSQAVIHVSHHPHQPFDFIATSRLPRPLHPHYPRQLATFLRLAVHHGIPADDVARVLASSVVFDAYPPSAHEFCPADVFSTLYAAPLRSALEATPDVVPSQSGPHPSDVTRYLGNITAQVCRMVDERHTTSTPPRRSDRLTQCGRGANSTHSGNCHRDWALQSHLQTFKASHERVRWEKAKSGFCFCLMDRPQHVLLCAHALCDGCVRRSGKQQVQQEHCYSLGACPICSTPGELRVILKPPTAGVRILSVDGGGVRAVIALQFLRLLQRALRCCGRVQDYFDIGFGVSAGALVALGLFKMQWDVDHVTEVFCQTVTRTLEASADGPNMPLSSMRVLRSLLRNGHYSAESVASASKQTFGSTRRLFDTPIDGISRCKAVVTTTTVGDASAVIFPTYNLPLARTEADTMRSGKRSLATYRRFDRDTFDVEPRLWEVAAATSAAPPYFHPVTLGQHGDEYQDGGLHNSNPTNIAMEESAQIWAPLTRCDIVVSLGAGLPRALSPQEPTLRKKFLDCSAFRLLRWSRVRLGESIDAESVHHEIQRMFNAFDPRTRPPYYRLNLELPGDLPALDDTTCMDSLMAGVEHSQDVSKLVEIRLALIASSFYFELDRLPSYDRSGHYICTGSVRIRGDPQHVLGLVRTVHPGRVQLVKSGEDLVDVQLAERVCRLCGRFDLPIRFMVPNLADLTTLSIRLGRAREHRISGFPQSVEWFVRQQGLDDPFSPGVPFPDVCICRSPARVQPLVIRKRTASSRATSATSKKRRTQVAPSLHS